MTNTSGESGLLSDLRYLEELASDLEEVAGQGADLQLRLRGQAVLGGGRLRQLVARQHRVGDVEEDAPELLLLLLLS